VIVLSSPDHASNGYIRLATHLEPWAAVALSALPDDIKVDASFAKGDTKNVIATSSASPNFAMFGSTGVPGAYQSIGLGATTDAV
jgi:hypothetical protein